MSQMEIPTIEIYSDHTIRDFGELLPTPKDMKFCSVCGRPLKRIVIISSDVTAGKKVTQKTNHMGCSSGHWFLIPHVCKLNHHKTCIYCGETHESGDW